MTLTFVRDMSEVIPLVIEQPKPTVGKQPAIVTQLPAE